MEIFEPGISGKKIAMRKFHLCVVLPVFVAVAVNAQSDKKEPPPPPPPKMETAKFSPPKVIRDEKIKVQPVVKVKGKLADDFYNRNKDVSEITRQGNIIFIKKKDGTIEKYDMNKKDDEDNFIKKYGDPPIPPPPPPPPAKIDS